MRRLAEESDTTPVIQSISLAHGCSPNETKCIKNRPTVIMQELSI
jgi:hypothetical protein